jgi:polar amino acid transport system substrate-binding protein
MKKRLQDEKIVLSSFETPMRALHILAMVCLLLTFSAKAENLALTISTNNTPQDRKALELLSKEAFRRVGLALKLDSNPSERSLDLANQGAVDGEGLRVAGLDQQYPNLVQVPERFIGISFVAFSRDQSIKLDDGWRSLKPYRIAFINGWKLYEANATAAQSITKVDKAEQLFQMLDAGRVDLALYTRADGASVLKRLGITGVDAIRPALREADMYLYLNKKHAMLVPRIAQALKDMKGDGSYNAILAQVASQ